MLIMGMTRSEWSKHRYRKRAFNVANAILNSRVAKPETRVPLVMVSHNAVSRSISRNDTVATMNGSSLNRRISKERKNELEALHQGPEKNAKKGWGEIHGQGPELLQQLERDRNAKLGDKGKFSFPLSERGLRLYVPSKRTRGNIKDRIRELLGATPGAGHFVTLTFIDVVTDILVARKCWNKFRTVVKKRMPGWQYIKIKEYQEKNHGSIHFHLVTNQRMEVEEWNSLWVLQQYNCGITYPKYSMSDINAHHLEGTMQKILNPFQIEKIRDGRLVRKYLSKYVSKNLDTPGEGQIWHCSRGVSRMFKRIMGGFPELQQARSWQNGTLDKKTGEIKEPYSCCTPFSEWIYRQNETLFVDHLGVLDEVNGWILEGMQEIDVPEILADDVGSLFHTLKI